MKDIWDRLMEDAARRGRPVGEAVRCHILEGLLRRVGRLPRAEGFVLRGGMLTRLWAPSLHRPVQDLDFVGTFPHGVEETARRFSPALADDGTADGLRFDPAAFRARGIWLDTAFPGVRLFVRVRMGEEIRDLSIDVGFGDPLVPPAQLLDYPTLTGGAPARVWCCRPETMAGWKLHGLAEKGERRWRAKDLYDLLLICEQTILDPSDLGPALVVAFTSRGFTVDDARALLAPAAWWSAKGSRVRWEEFRRDGGAPEEVWGLDEAVARVRGRLLPALEERRAGGEL